MDDALAVPRVSDGTAPPGPKGGTAVAKPATAVCTTSGAAVMAARDAAASRSGGGVMEDALPGCALLVALGWQKGLLHGLFLTAHLSLRKRALQQAPSHSVFGEGDRGACCNHGLWFGLARSCSADGCARVRAVALGAMHIWSSMVQVGNPCHALA